MRMNVSGIMLARRDRLSQRLAAISQMRVDFVFGPSPGSPVLPVTPAAFLCPRKSGEIEAAGKSDAGTDAPTAPFDSFFGQSPSRQYLLNR
jgi:hypothetical protein